MLNRIAYKYFKFINQSAVLPQLNRRIKRLVTISHKSAHA